ncbi:ABC transporter ATP-binding protein [Serpentinicella sp. ANB-PHB4]|uniref:ABC transporter ATP-binding protein n=1 Tax=Serpentinicella sp. ANB-PHB4 TaxID=3074076 RepID=UPI00285CCBCE|nr:ABC transporter ATP-binding protein [Serpentinicella sp. ANB-PHB4]MDR5658605.1 ABC transporter ATP-binding protein [Serpentinicella sp. ANB-PHB4]
MSEIILRTENLGIAFGAHKAVNDVTIGIEKGKFTTILGPNGAGKTTFFNLVSGLLTPTTGKIFFKGTDVTSLSPIERVSLGMGRSFQLTNVFPTLTAYENVRLAAQSYEKVGFKIFTNHNKFSKVNEKTEEILERVLLHNKKDELASNLTHGEQRKLELGMVLALDPEVLLLDEPTAGMAIEEVPAMIDILKKTHTAGTTIVLIEHKMDMVKMLSDRLSILVNGALIADGDPDTVSKNPEVLAAYLGGGVIDAEATFASKG